MPQTQLDQWNEQFALPGLKFELGKGNLVRALIDTPVALGEMYLHGSHVTRWQPVGQEPVLWLSGASQFELGKPIRGGVPICFPWFGPHPTDSQMPAHGLARTQLWKMESTSVAPGGGIQLQLCTEIGGYAVRFQATFGRQLKMILETRRVDSTPAMAAFEDALHTYLAVADVHSIDIRGLEQCSFIDKMDQAAVKPPTGSPIVFHGETDRVYLDTSSVCLLQDRRLNRVIRLEKSGSLSTVVWNPWIEKSARMPDFGDDEWTGMVCIETANVGGNRIELQPGQSHSTEVCLSVDSLS